MSDPIKPFIPALGLKHPKAQMLWPFVLNSLIRTHSTERHETFTLSDDDVIDLTWYGPQHGPIVLMLHGITGHANSPYCKTLTYFLAEKGWRACVIHARGCGRTPNRLHKSHHGADTLGLSCVVQHLHNQSPTTPLMAVGFSLGGSVLLNYLATQHTLTAAVGHLHSTSTRYGRSSTRSARGTSVSKINFKGASNMAETQISATTSHSATLS